MTDYKPNSNRSKEEKQEREKRVEKPVVTSNVITKKKSGVRKLADEFISEDAKNIKSYVIGDVIIPSIKKALCDIVKDGIEMLLYGGTKHGSGRRSTADRVSYGNYYDRETRPARTLSSSAAYSCDDIIISSRGEAEDVLARLDEIMDTYKLVRVADLYDLVGVSAPHTAYGYGWTNIRNAEIVRTRDGYMIKMPRAVPID